MVKVLFLLLLSNLVIAQTKISIDSLNNISFAIKQKNASILVDDFLLNAKNAKKINYELGEAQSYSNVSLMYYYQGRYDLDIYYSLRAINLYEKIDNKEKSALEYGELGYRMKKSNLQKAVYYMQKGKNIAEKYRYQKPLLSIYNNYGYLKTLQNQTDSALFYYKKCLIIKEEIKDSVGIPYSLNNIAMVFIEQKKYKEAEKLLNRALKIRVKLHEETGIAENFFYLGDLNFNQNNFNNALKNYKKSLSISEKNKYLDLMKSCYQIISETYEKTGDNKSSLQFYKKFNQAKDSLINKETNSKIAALEIEFDTAKKEKQILQQQADAKQKNVYLIGLTVLALLIGLIGYLIYKQQRQKNQQQAQENELKSAIASIENQNKLQEQRLSISRDLHDNIGSQLTFIISSVDNVKYGFDIQNEKLDSKLTNISSFAKDTIVELRDTIWAMNSKEITFEDLEARINNFIEKAKISQENISFSFATEDVLKSKKLTSVQGMNIYRTIQEAINNSLKYANADIISVNIKQQNDKTKIMISDNGNGFDVEEQIVSDLAMKGNGLNNMKKRIEEIGGNFDLTSTENGTKIEILI